MKDSEKLAIFGKVIKRLGMEEFDSHVFLNMLQRRYPMEYANLLADTDDTEAHRKIGKFLSDNQKELNIENTGKINESLNIHNETTSVPIWKYNKND